jgi:hypothetical protein
MFSKEDGQKIKDALCSQRTPYVSVSYSTLGGEANAAFLICASFDHKDTWTNGILENSRYTRISIDKDGTIKEFSRSYNNVKMRKTKAKTLEEALAKINVYLDKATPYGMPKD